mgnify:CR=1 FL=1
MKRKIIYIGIIGMLLLTGFTTFAVGLKTKIEQNNIITDVDPLGYDHWFKGLINDYKDVTAGTGTKLSVVFGMEGGRGFAPCQFVCFKWITIYERSPQSLGLTEEDHGKLQWVFVLGH